MLAVEILFYRWFQLKNKCKKKLEGLTQEPPMETHSNWWCIWCISTGGSLKPPAKMDLHKRFFY